VETERGGGEKKEGRDRRVRGERKRRKEGEIKKKE